MKWKKYSLGRVRTSWLGAGVLLLPVLTLAAAAQDIAELSKGEVLEREIAGREIHQYQFEMDKSEYVSIVVEQRGVDVVVFLFGPSGRQLVQVDSPTGDEGEERVTWFSTSSLGSYRVEVRPFDFQAPRGVYDIEIEELRIATDEDRNEYNAQQSYEKGRSAWSRGRIGEAGELWEQAVEYEEAAMGPAHPKVADRLMTLASHYAARMRYSEAAELAARALAIREEATPAQPIDVTASLLFLADLGIRQEHFGGVSDLQSRALEIAEEAGLRDRDVLATVLLQRAKVDVLKGNLTDAESLYGRALVIYEEAFGAESDNLAALKGDLGRLYKDQGKYAEAEKLLRNYIRIMLMNSGPYTAGMASGLRNLAEVLIARDKLRDAEPIYAFLLDVGEKLFGPDHPETASTLEGYASLLRRLERGAEADDMEARARAIRAADARESIEK